jgi:DNA repair protein RadC
VGFYYSFMKKQTYILSEIELRYNPKVPAIKKPRIKCSQDAHKQFLDLMDQTQFNIKEEAAVLFMNRGNRVIGGYKLSTGGITGTVVDIRIILCMALKSLASGIILSHTHPSGEMNPSTADLDLTKKLSESAKLMDIKLVDHLIISNNGYLSFADEGLI